MEDGKVIITQLEEALTAIKNVVEGTRKDNVTTLEKIDRITIETGIDLIMVADEISKKSLNSLKTGIQKDEFSKIIFNEIGNFISDMPKIKELKAEDKLSETVELIKKINARNNRIYEILFDEKVDFSGLTAIQERKKQNELQIKIVSQLTILISEATMLSYEALLENAKKIMG